MSHLIIEPEDEASMAIASTRYSEYRQLFLNDGADLQDLNTICCPLVPVLSAVDQRCLRDTQTDNK